MKISPISSTQVVNPELAQAAPNIRSLKMPTNATPGRVLEEEGQELSISDDNSNITDKTTATVEATEPLSPQFAALAKQRRALQQEKRAFLDEKKAFEAASQGSDSVPLARIQSDTMSVLREAGVTYEQLTEAILNGQDSSEINDLKAKIDALEKGVDKKLTDRDQLAKKQVLAEMQREAENIIVDNDEFELVRETASVPQVMALIERTYDDSGEVLEVTEALKLVEDELFARNQKLANLKKIKGLFQPQNPSVPQQRPQGMRTLTNRDTASVPMSAKARALAAFHGTLKK